MESAISRNHPRIHVQPFVFMSSFVVFLNKNRLCECSLPEEQRWDDGGGGGGISTV